MTDPVLSVVVPAYNNAQTIRETIQSIIGQQGVDFELIIADHTSSDDTHAIIEEFAGHSALAVLTTPPGGGAPRNWQRVTDAATGTFIKLVCGDDVLLPGTLARQVSLLQTSGAVLTACRRDVVDARGAVLKRGWGLSGIDMPLAGHLAARRAVRAGRNLFGEPASVMLLRSALNDAGGWFDRFPYLIDQASYSRVLMRGDFVPDPHTGATFRMSATQWSVALTKEQSSQAQAFHQWMRETYPDAISDRDVLLGNAKAVAMARARRLSYKILERRMR